MYFTCCSKYNGNRSIKRERERKSESERDNLVAQRVLVTGNGGPGTRSVTDSGLGKKTYSLLHFKDSMKTKYKTKRTPVQEQRDGKYERYRLSFAKGFPSPSTKESALATHRLRTSLKNTFLSR